jgi:quercetin dioxygenase-like cupin family protein
MRIIRRDLLGMCGAMTALPGFTALALAQQAGPKLVQVLRKDLEGQGQVVQETVVSIAEFAPGSAAPWHQHPGAQELLHVIEGGLTVEIDGRAPLRLNAGEAGIIDAELIHLARNETTAAARAVVVHSRAAKDKPLVVVVRK